MKEIYFIGIDKKIYNWFDDFFKNFYYEYKKNSQTSLVIFHSKNGMHSKLYHSNDILLKKLHTKFNLKNIDETFLIRRMIKEFFCLDVGITALDENYKLIYFYF